MADQDACCVCGDDTARRVTIGGHAFCLDDGLFAGFDCVDLATEVCTEGLEAVLESLESLENTDYDQGEFEFDFEDEVGTLIRNSYRGRTVEDVEPGPTYLAVFCDV
jgi:hypothetical protein